MFDLAEIQTIYYMAAATGVMIAAVYYVMTFRATLKTRQVQLFMNVYQRFEEPDFQNAYWDIMSWQWRDFEDFLAKYSEQTNPEDFRKLSMVGTFFEGLGVLVKMGFIDATIVDDLMSMFIIGWYQKFDPVYIGLRKMWNTPTVEEYGEFLHDVVYGIWKQQHPGYEKPTLSQ